MTNRYQNTRYRASVLILDQGQILTVQLEDPVSQERFYSLPGGGVEPGETPFQAAKREAFEETGYQVVLEKTPWPFTYDFAFAGKIWKCVSTFYLGGLQTPGQRLENPFIQDSVVTKVTWLSSRDFSLNFSYHQPCSSITRKCCRPRRSILANPQFDWQKLRFGK